VCERGAVTGRRLNRQAVVEAATQRIDADGWRTVTMSDLARELGVQGPTLYSHVESLEALFGMVQVDAHRLLADELLRAAVGRSGAAAFRAMAAALRRFAADHPGLYDLATSEVIDPPAVFVAGEPSSAALAAVIESFGLDSTVELQVNCLASLHGVLVLDRAHFYGDDVDVDAMFDRAVDMVVLWLEHEGNRE